MNKKEKRNADIYKHLARCSTVRCEGVMISQRAHGYSYSLKYHLVYGLWYRYPSPWPPARSLLGLS